jgi:hypothetical protein
MTNYIPCVTAETEVPNESLVLIRINSSKSAGLVVPKSQVRGRDLLRVDVVESQQYSALVRVNNVKGHGKINPRFYVNSSDIVTL